MPDDDPIQELGRKLLRQGFPGRYVVDILREMVEHREDLEQEALEAGSTSKEARAVATEKLGDIDNLTKAILATRRRCRWWGRHPLFTFVALPLPISIFLFLGLVLLGAKVFGVIEWSEHRTNLPEPDWAMLTIAFYAALCGAIAITAFMCCDLARRCCCGLKWALIACLIIFIHGLFFHAGFTPPHGQEYGNFWIGYRLRLPTTAELIAWTMPLIVFGGYSVHARKARLTKISY